MKRVLLMTACLMLAVVAWSRDEGEYQKWMQTAGATVGSLQKNLKAKNGEAAAADAHKLHMVFDEVHGFWEKKNVDDGMKFAMGARDGFHKIAEQASAGQFDEASATFKETTANCGGCHSAHREKAADGSFKIKY
jgi:cytochrome c556